VTDGVDDRGAFGAATDAGPGRPAPGWYPDPWVGGQHRYWTGDQWTADVFPDGPLHQGPEPLPEWSPYDPYVAAEAVTDRPVRPRSERPLAAVLLIVGLVVGFVAVVSIVNAVTDKTGPNPSTATPTVPAPTLPPETAPTAPTAPTTPPLPGDLDQSALSGLVIGQADVPAGFTLQPRPDGQPTLDVCNGTFPSEALRTARQQVDAIDAQGGDVFSTEAVLYKNAAATTQAFSELRTVAASCPATPVQSPVGDPTVTTHFNPTPDGAWAQTPGVDRLAFDFTTTDAAGQTTHSIGVYLRRGRVLMGIYFPQPDGPQTPIGGKTTIADIVNVFAGRMAQLPASVVDRS
jgi:hypothetical protein